MVSRRKFHKACKRLKANLATGNYEKNYGICNNLYQLLHTTDFHDNIHQHLNSWPYFSGNKFYPVPGYDNLDECEAYYYHTGNDVWNGEYGWYRRHLLDHLITQSYYPSLIKRIKSYFNNQGK
jgi:hypothetical protein